MRKRYREKGMKLEEMKRAGDIEEYIYIEREREGGWWNEIGEDGGSEGGSQGVRERDGESERKREIKKVGEIEESPVRERNGLETDAKSEKERERER